MRRRFSSRNDVVPEVPEWSAFRNEPVDQGFAAEHIAEAALRIFKVIRMGCLLHIIMGICHILSGNSEHMRLVWSALMFVPFGTLALESRIRRGILQWPLLVGSCMQLFMHAITQLLFVIMTTQSGVDPILKHRMFLTSWFPALFAFPIVSYVPFPQFVSIVCPIYALSWFSFHYVVGYLNVSSCAYAILILALKAYSISDHDNGLWDSYRKKVELESERRELLATQVTLHNMLSSLFDASCVCDRHGNLRRWTPQLQQLLSGDQGLSGSQLSSFAATDSDAKRLRQFLGHASQSAIRQAAKIQVELRSQRSDSLTVAASQDGTEGMGNGFETCHCFEAALYAIRLPDSVTGANDEQEKERMDSCSRRSHSPRGSDGLFICFQKEAVVCGQGKVDAVQTWTDQVAKAELEEEDEELSEDVFGKSKTLRQSDTPADAEDTPRSSLNFTDSTSNLAQVPQMGSVASDSHSNHSLTFTQSSALSDEPLRLAQMPGRPRIGRGARRLRSQSIQTDGPKRVEISTQTLSTLPPKLPGAKFRRKHVTPADRRHSVQFGGSFTCLLPHFSETPLQTMEHMIVEIVYQLNPRGRGCCGWHMCLAALMNSLRGMLQKECLKDFTPHTDRQCGECFAMNELGDVIDEESELGECACCGSRLQATVQDQLSRSSESACCRDGDQSECQPSASSSSF